MHKDIVKRLKQNGKYIDWESGKVITIGTSTINKSDIKFIEKNFKWEQFNWVMCAKCVVLLSVALLFLYTFLAINFTPNTTAIIVCVVALFIVVFFMSIMENNER
jgi:MFS-type transporter involved in bile tolerance (Atg22 family)